MGRTGRALCCVGVVATRMVMAQEPVVFRIDPQTVAVPPGGTATFNVVIDPRGNPVVAAAFAIDFSASHIEVLELTPGPAMDVHLRREYDNAAGTIDYAGGRDWLARGTVRGPTVLAAVRIRLHGAGETSVLTFLPGQAGGRQTGAGDLWGEMLPISVLNGEIRRTGALPSPTFAPTPTPRASDTPTVQPSATPWRTPTATHAPAPTATPTLSPHPTATPTPQDCTGCVGDCLCDGEVTVDDILKMVTIALGLEPVAVCPAADPDGTGTVTIDRIVLAVNHALGGCPPDGR